MQAACIQRVSTGAACVSFVLGPELVHHQSKRGMESVFCPPPHCQRKVEATLPVCVVMITKSGSDTLFGTAGRVPTKTGSFTTSRTPPIEATQPNPLEGRTSWSKPSLLLRLDASAAPPEKYGSDKEESADHLRRERHNACHFVIGVLPFDSVKAPVPERLARQGDQKEYQGDFAAIAAAHRNRDQTDGVT